MACVWEMMVVIVVMMAMAMVLVFWCFGWREMVEVGKAIGDGRDTEADGCMYVCMFV